MRKILSAIVAATFLAGCANHPVDCAIGFHHEDCLPGTAGYDDPHRFDAADDQQCRGYGLAPGSSQYADCRLKLSTQHHNPGPY